MLSETKKTRRTKTENRPKIFFKIETKFNSYCIKPRVGSVAPILVEEADIWLSSEPASVDKLLAARGAQLVVGNPARYEFMSLIIVCQKKTTINHKPYREE